MDRAKTTTPPATPSRASTIALDNIERAAQMSPPMSSSQSSDMERVLIQAEAQVPRPYKQESANDFKPHQMLMETTISVEYGEHLTSKLTMHEGILCCHSKSLDQLFAKAKTLRGQYANTKLLMGHLASFVFPEATAKQFEDDGMEQKAISTILHIYEKLALLEYQKGTKRVIDAAVEEQITQKNTKAPHSNGGISKKSKDASHDTSLRARLPLLKPRGVQTVAEQLYARLHRIMKMEADKAKSDPAKAAAQHRILLPNIEETAIQSLMQWIYRGTVHCGNAEQLYALLNLSTQLGVEALAEICLSNLSNAATESIQGALANGVPLQSLLGYGSTGSTDNVLEVVFINVFKDKNPPKRLLNLVIDTLADSLDMELWAQLRDLIGHEMALQLIDAMIVRQQIKTELSAGVKPESDDTATEQLLFVPNNQH